MDFVSRFNELENLGYKGPFMIEMWYKDGTNDLTEIQKAVDYLSDKFNKGVKKC